MRKNFKLLLAGICMMIGMLSATAVQAGVRYLNYETVSKTGPGTVHSNSTGTLTFHVEFGAKCTAGTMYVTPQYYTADGYRAVEGATKMLDKGLSLPGESVYYSPIKIFRLELSYPTGRGTGWIQGKE